MPFKSKAQIAKFGELVKQGKMPQKTFDEWMAATPSAQKLPERIGPKKEAKPMAPRFAPVVIQARRRK